MSANDGGDPVVLGKDPVERPALRRDAEGRFMVDLRETVATVAECEEVATVVARQGNFLVTYHSAVYCGWYTGNYGRILAADTVVTWEKLPAQ